MSEKQPPHGAGDHEEELKKELKNLPLVKAPWFFEAELQRRLHERKKRSLIPRIIARPVPAYALSGIGVILVGVITYLMMVTTSEMEPLMIDTPAERNDLPSPGQMQHQQSLTPERIQSETSIIGNDPSGRGPSAGGGGATIESKIDQGRSTVPGSETQTISEPLFEVSTSQGTSPATLDNSVFRTPQSDPAALIHFFGDSARLMQSSRDSLDSLAIPPDSIRRKPPKPSGK